MSSARRIGAWELLQPLGSGATGSVWRVRAADGREGALKLAHPEIAVLPTAAARWRRALRLAGAAPGGTLAALLAVEEWNDLPAPVWELFGEGTLADRLGPRPWAEPAVRAALADLLRGAAALAAAGVAHRDLHPGNCFWRGGRLVLGDLGAAAEAHDERTVVTGGPARQGAALVAPPEAAHGEWSAAGDIYAIGRIGLRLLGGDWRAPLTDHPLLAPLLAADRRDRPTAVEALAGLGVTPLPGEAAESADPVEAFLPLPWPVPGVRAARATGDRLAVGRAPAWDPAEGQPAELRRTLSRRHLLAGCDGDGAWLADPFSTWGVRQDGAVLLPGRRHGVDRALRLTLGERLELEAVPLSSANGSPALALLCRATRAVALVAPHGALFALDGDGLPWAGADLRLTVDGRFDGR